MRKQLIERVTCAVLVADVMVAPEVWEHAVGGHRCVQSETYATHDPGRRGPGLGIGRTGLMERVPVRPRTGLGYFAPLALWLDQVGRVRPEGPR